MIGKMTNKTTNKNIQAIKQIKNKQDIKNQFDMLSRIDPIFEQLVKPDDIPLRLKKPTFQTFVEIIVSQLISRDSANAIIRRLPKPVEPITYIKIGTKPLIEAGFSKAKQETVIRLANEIKNGLNLKKISRSDENEIVETLTKIKGIGPWSAEIFALGSGHPNVFPAHDVALRQAIVDVGIVRQRPNHKQAKIIAKKWSPVQSTAARVLWMVYAKNKTTKTAKK